MNLDTNAIPGFETMTDSERLSAVLGIVNGNPDGVATTTAAVAGDVAVPTESATTATTTTASPAVSAPQTAATQVSPAVPTGTEAAPEAPAESAEETIRRLQQELSKRDRQLNSANREAADYKRKMREMTTASKVQESSTEKTIAEMQAQMEEMRRKSTLTDYTSDFISAGFAQDTAAECAAAAMDGDMKTLSENIASLVRERENAIRAEQYKTTSRGVAGTANTRMTKEEYRKLPLTEKNRMYETNIALYEQMNKR